MTSISSAADSGPGACSTIEEITAAVLRASAGSSKKESPPADSDEMLDHSDDTDTCKTARQNDKVLQHDYPRGIPDEPLIEAHNGMFRRA